jgi:hypothetical protein
MVYNPALYPVGTTVKIAPREAFEAFLRTWQLHHPLEPSQLADAGKIAVVAATSMYHGGDILYELQAFWAFGTSDVWRPSEAG